MRTRDDQMITHNMFYYICFHLETARPTKQFSTIGAFVTGGAVPPFMLDPISEGSCMRERPGCITIAVCYRRRLEGFYILSIGRRRDTS
jgi:hypothetical protein